MVDELEAERAARDSASVRSSIGVIGSDSAEGREYIRRQNKLAEMQIRSLEQADKFELSHLRFRRFGDYAKAAMEAAVALLIAALVAGFGALIWQARSAHGLVVESFHTPPDLAVRGLDGTVLAQHAIDDLNSMVTKSAVLSYRAADDIGGNWGDDSKVEIPETGVSIGELARSLRGWLGHETRLTGEIYRDGDRIIIQLRAGTNAPVIVSGAERDLDALIAHAAEGVFAQTQPFLYQLYLGAVGRPQEALTLARDMALNGSAQDRPWGYASWSNSLQTLGDYRQAVLRANQALALDPDNPQAFSDLFLQEWGLGHLEATMTAGKNLVATLSRGRSDFSPLMLGDGKLALQQGIEELNGSWRDSITHDEIMEQFTIYQFNRTIPPLMVMDYGQIYDATTARQLMRGLPQWDDKKTTAQFAIMGPELPVFMMLAADDDWAAAAKDLEDVDRYTLPLHTVDDVRHSLIWPWLAYSWARTGQIAKARALIAETPLDCSLCLRLRGRIAELNGEPRAATNWYARADADAPSYPFALTDWGTMLLRHGDIDSAIAKFEEANRRVPHFADAIELWGEALMQQNRSDLALAKFAEAAKYAPNWGRLHLEWGRAFLWSGDSNPAHKQFALAANLHLSAQDRAALSKLAH
jgi:tetratricopeptide (TPR) repeat protein